MEYRKLGNTDMKVSVVGFGTWQGSLRGWGKDYSKESIISAIREAFENGINFFDTAEIYGDGLSEKILGEALSIYKRDEYIIATKIAPFNLNKAEKSLNKSIERLNSKYVDLYQIHWPPSVYSNLEKSMKNMFNLVKSEKVRYIGVSNFDVGLLKTIKDYHIVSNQIKYNIIQRSAEKDLISYMRENNIDLIAYSPLEMGALTGKYGKNKRPNGYVRKTAEIFKEKNIEKLEKLNEFLKNISIKYNCTVSQISLAYIIKKGGIPIPGAKNIDQARNNALASRINISDEDIKNIDNFVNNLFINHENSWYKSVRYIPSFITKLIFSRFI